MTPKKALQSAPLSAIEQDNPGAVQNTATEVEMPETAANEAVVEPATPPEFTTATELTDSVIEQAAAIGQKDNGNEEGLSQAAEAEVVPEIITEAEEMQNKSEDTDIDDDSAVSGSTTSEASEESVIEMKNMKADESGTVDETKDDVNDAAIVDQATTSVDMTTDDEAQTQLVTRHDVETCTDRMTSSDEKDTQTETARHLA
jgi:hypothetical protein